MSFHSGSDIDDILVSEPQDATYSFLPSPDIDTLSPSSSHHTPTQTTSSFPNGPSSQNKMLFSASEHNNNTEQNILGNSSASSPITTGNGDSSISFNSIAPSSSYLNRSFSSASHGGAASYPFAGNSTSSPPTFSQEMSQISRNQGKLCAVACIFSSIFATLGIVELFLSYDMMNTFTPPDMNTPCSASGFGWNFYILILFIAIIIPLVFMFKELYHILSPIPSSGPTMITFNRPVYNRKTFSISPFPFASTSLTSSSAASNAVVTADEYQIHMIRQTVTWLQSINVILAVLNAFLALCTTVILSPSSMCAEHPSVLVTPFLVGCVLNCAIFISVAAFVIKCPSRLQRLFQLYPTTPFQHAEEHSYAI